MSITTIDLLMARLGAERARLLHTLIGISEADFTGSQVQGDWTCVHVLAHLAWKDRWCAQRIELVLAGRAAEIEPSGDANQTNAAAFETFKDWSASQAISAFCEAAHELDTALNNVIPFKKIEQPLQFQQGRGSIARWLGQRAAHDAHHATHLLRWKRTLARTFSVGPRQLMIEAIHAANEDFFQSMRLIALDGGVKRKLIGNWNLTQIHGHLADWNQFFIHTLNGTGAATFMGDEDTFNDRKEAARKQQTFKAANEDFEESFDTLMQTLEGVPDAEWSKPPVELLYPTVYHCAWSALEHLLDHAAMLRAAKPDGWPQRLLHVKGPYT